MPLNVVKTDVWTHNCSLRIPFSFGVTTLHELPQVFVTVDVEINGKTERGIAADHLVPRWFSKAPDKTPDEDIADLENVIHQACEHAVSLEPKKTPFTLWKELYERQQVWGEGIYPPLVWGFGVSLVERGVIDAFCRATNTTFAEAVRENTLGIRLGTIYDELANNDIAEYLPEQPRSEVSVRHTVGYEDPLTDGDVDQGSVTAEGGPVSDGLPHTLEEVINAYGISHFKVKIKGDPSSDKERIRDVVDLVEKHVNDPLYTLDANEQYESISNLTEFWNLVSEDRKLSGFKTDLAFIEQPFPRDTTCSAEICEKLPDWEGPQVIIDESDARPSTLEHVLECGYAGTSHKNCKGVIKSVANACLLRHRSRKNDRKYAFSAEDLTTIGPVALPQDLAVVAALGIEHVERNGHHYLRGLDGLPSAVQEEALDKCSRLYQSHEKGFPTLTIQDGRLNLKDVNDVPFGIRSDLDRSDFD